jgi:agmatinase
MELIYEQVKSLIDRGKFTVMLGGEHTCTFPSFKAHHERYKDLSILQLDAHSDLRNSYEGNKWSHASVMARVHERNVRIAQLGIRALCTEEADLIRLSDNIRTVFAFQMHSKLNWEDELLEHLTDKVYLTVDADAFDPSIIPGTGTPEPGGLLWYPTLGFLERLFREKDVVGFDIVECSPRQGEIISEFTLAKLLYKLLGFRYLKPESD